MSSSPGAKRLGSLGAILARVRRSAGRGTARSIRRARRLRLEGLEHRQLLSVSPLVLPASPVEDVGAITSTELPGGDPSAESEPLAPATNAPPTAVDDAFSMTGNQQLGAGVLANDVDPDGDPLSVTLDSDASHGTLNLGSDGLFTYKPDEGFAGTDAFTYVANDGQAGSDPATVTISVASVNGPPRAENDVYATGQNQQLLVAADSGVLANDSDAQGDPLTTTLVEEPAHGTLALNADGSFEYTPETDFRGQDAFTYRASDGQSDSNLATASITVGPTNEAPQTVDDTYSTREDEPLSAAAAGVLANDTDADGDQLTAILESAPSHGTLTLGLDGSFDYTPNPDFSGSDSFTYLANDGQVEGNLATVSITIEPVNDAPVAVDDAYSVNEDETLVVEAAGVLTNDADVEGDLLAAVLVDGPAQGTLTLADDGSFEYTPNADFNGSDAFTYLANDGQAESNLATVEIEVRQVDLAVTLQVSGTAFGPNAGATWAGSTFWVNAYVEDLRDMPQGVVGGAVDVLYDSLWVTPTGSVAYGEDFTAFQQGTPDEPAGLIDEAGALTTEGGVGADGLAPFVAWQFAVADGQTASTGDGPVHFGVEPGEGTATITPANFALVGSGDPVDWALVELGAVDLDLALADFNGDELVNHFDLALWQPHSGSASGDPSYDPASDLDGDGRIDERDLDLLMAAMYQPVGPSPIVPETLAASELPAEGDATDDAIPAPQAATEPGKYELARHRKLRAHDHLFARRSLWG